MVINTERGINIEFIHDNLFFSPTGAAECSKPKLSVIVVCEGILCTFRVLLNLLAFNILFWVTANLLLEDSLKSYKVIHFHIIFAVVFAADRDNSR